MKNPILSIGTKIVTQTDLIGADGVVLVAKGAVAAIIKAPVDPLHAYRVRFVDGYEANLKREAFVLYRHYQGIQADEAPDEDLFEYIIYRCVVGSRAYGLDHAESDTDRRGIYLPPAEAHWSLVGVPEQLEKPEEQYWELQKFLSLALKANPNVLECLYTPLVEFATPLADELRDMRSIFLSQLIYQTYNGYVMSQFRKLHKDLENYGEIRWKHAMHLIRLLLSGIAALETGEVPIAVTDHRDKLLQIRRGEIAWEEINAWRLDLHHQFDAAFATTHLPDRPDYEKANAFLLKARRRMVR